MKGACLRGRMLSGVILCVRRSGFFVCFELTSIVWLASSSYFAPTDGRVIPSLCQQQPNNTKLLRVQQQLMQCLKDRSNHIAYLVLVSLFSKAFAVFRAAPARLRNEHHFFCTGTNVGYRVDLPTAISIRALYRYDTILLYRPDV